MGFLGRMRSISYAIIKTFVSGFEDKYVIEPALSQSQQATKRLKEGSRGLTTYQALYVTVQQNVEDGRRRGRASVEEVGVGS